jgi:GT2 family glycosyltransferase
MKVGIGMVTYNRPEYFAQSIQGIVDHLFDRCDVIYVYNDHSSEVNMRKYKKIYATLPDKVEVFDAPKNRGVAVAKNYLLRRMMEEGCDYLFLIEDDIVVQDVRAVTWYIAASKKFGSHHLMFAHHGPGNMYGPKFSEQGIEYFDNCVGAFTMYTRAAIEAVGYMDETMYNAYEHVEHTWRLCNIGMCPPMWNFMDVYGSWRWLRDIPGSIDNSSIRQDAGWVAGQIKSLEKWKAKDPDNFPLEHVLKALKK